MSVEDKKHLAIKLLGQKNRHWNGATLRNNLVEQEGHQTVHRVVDILSGIIEKY